MHNIQFVSKDSETFYHQKIIIMNELNIKGNWNLIKGKLKQEFAELTDDDLAYQEGQEDELLGRLQKKLGKTKEELKKFFEM
jgi:uncharacterized protein YjbJ (UPF0337 family)